MIKNKNYNFIIRQTNMRSSSGRLINLIIILALFVVSSYALIPTGPIIASPNTQSSPANFIFSFQLAKNMLPTSYLMVVLPIFPSTIVPISCTLLNTVITSTSCINLATASATTPNPLTINTTAVNNINPNIQSTLTIVVGFNSNLLAGTSYALQLFLNTNLPSIGALSSSFEMYCISGTGIIEEQNWNMGQLFLELKNNNLMNMVSINAQNTNLPGVSVSTLQVTVTIGVAVPTPLSKFILTISGNFAFTVSSLVSSLTVTGAPPQILSMTVVSPNIIQVIFNEQFTVGRQFALTVSNIYNPLELSQGAVSIYSMPYNSISPLEISQLSIPYQTVSYTPTVTILTAEGISPFSPIQYYLETIQYITVTILLPRNFDPSFVLQVKSDVLLIQQGTVYARTSTINNNNLQYSLTDNQTVVISGFSTVPSGSLITVTMRVWIGTNPIFNIYVSIDTQAHIDLSLPIIYGTASATVSAMADNFISAFTGSLGETNKLTAMQTTTSSISFSVTPLFQTYTGSFLQIYTCENLVAASGFSGTTSCTLNGTAQPCTITTNTQYTVIKIASSSSFNLYPQSATTTVVISQLQFNFASSHSLYLYHFYFKLTVSLASSAPQKKYLAAPMILKQRNQISNFQMYISNNIFNSGSNFLNTVRVVSTDNTQWQNVIQSNQKRIVSIFAYQGWTNLFTTLKSYSSYPCASNIAATCTFIRGSNYLNSSTDFPMNWDRITILLPGTQTTSKFSVLLPTLFLTTSAVLFQIMIGFVDTTNGAITYLQSGPLPTGGASTYLLPQNILVYSKPQQSAMQINIAGLAGSYGTNISITVAPSATFNGNGYSTALIIVSNWQFFDSTTGLTTTTLGSVDPAYNNVEQLPLCIKISSSSYLTYIPFRTSGIYASNFNIYFNNIKYPYNLDLPYHSISLIDSTGSMDGYNQFINQNQNTFYTGVLRNLSITCNDNSLGVTNTYCTIVFTPFQDIEVNSVLITNLYGMYVSTNMCSMMYSSSSLAIPVASCSPNNNLNVLTINLANSARLPALTSYSLIINGISIDSSQIQNYVQLLVMDPSGSYAIEQKSVILIPSVTQNFPIYINQINFAINNPVVTNSIFMNFTLPRPLNSDQSFALIMSKDFTNLNNIPCKMKIRLMQSDGITQIPVQWILKYINSQIIFQGLKSELTAATYSIQMYGVINPSTITQTSLGIIYLRVYDNTYTKSNTLASTASFPTLVSKIDSLITLQTFFNTEGLQHELLFTIINQYVQITQSSVWIINFPRYYSPLIWNEDFLIYCTINQTPLSCSRSQHTPYQIQLSNSPLIVSVGSTYTISVYGIPCPRATYMNGNSLFITESIFLAMLTSSSATSYSDYSQLFISTLIINPQTSSGYGTIVLQSATSSNMQVYQSTFFTITLTCSVDIPQNSWIFMTFPQEFNNFNNIPVVVQTQYGSNVQVSSSSSVINTRIGYQLKVFTSIPAGTQFQIIITSLLTPRSPGTINMNYLKILISNSDRTTTIATTTQSKNQLSSLTFLPNSLHLVVNNYNPITITAGTYSNAILIRPSDNSTFLTNMMITFSSTQLAFNPNPTYLYLGNAFSSFFIGVSQNMIPTTYTFNLAKKQTSISSFYSTLSQYAISVTSVPVYVTSPSAINVPVGGCSIPSIISVANPPFSSLTINYQFDTTVYPPEKFWVNQQTSYQKVSFDINNTQRRISFCANYTQAITSFTIQLQLGGDNAAAYQFTTNTLTINIVSNATLTSAPTSTLTVIDAQKTYARFQATTNLAGNFYYHLNLAPFSVPSVFSTIQAGVKANSLIIQSNSDYLTTKIYNADRDQRYGYVAILTAGSTQFSLEGLLTERAYGLCGYFQNQFGVATNYQCVNFTMQSWGTIRKTYVSFTTPILANQLNSLLCFFVKGSSSQISQIISLEGSSCSLYTSPQNYNYAYKGNTTSNQYQNTIIYHMPSINLTSDGSISAFNSLFSSSNVLTSSSLSTAQTQFTVNFISTSTLLTSFAPMTAMQASTSAFQPQFSFTASAYQKGTYRVTLSQIQSTLPSTAYFILVSYKNVSINQITSKTNITIKPLVTPTSSQIASCVDGQGFAALQCFRVVMIAGSTYSVTLPNLVQNSVYSLYYTIANEYPMRPIFYGNVLNQYIFTTSQLFLMVNAVLMVLAVLII